MFNTIYEDNNNPLIVYTRDELLLLRKKSEELARTRYRTCNKDNSGVINPYNLIIDASQSEQSNIKDRR